MWPKPRALWNPPLCPASIRGWEVTPRGDRRGDIGCTTCARQVWATAYGTQLSSNCKKGAFFAAPGAGKFVAEAVLFLSASIIYHHRALPCLTASTAECGMTYCK